MLKNYIKLATRYLWKNKLITGINTIGLSLGIACASLAFIFIQHEYSFNRFHTEHENIHWFYIKVGNRLNLSSTPPALGPTLQENLPEVTSYSRLEEKDLYIKQGQDLYREKVLLADKNFFSFFNFNLIKGNPDAVLSNNNSVILTKKMAEKYFGLENPIGKTIQVVFQEKESEFMVSGVSENAPTNSSIQFDFILPLAKSYETKPELLDSDWKSYGVSSFIRFQNDVVVTDELSSKIQALVEQQNPREDQSEIHQFIVNSFDDYHLNNSMGIRGLNDPGELSYVKMLSLFALFILVVACLNFMNLSNAQSSKRFTEVGVRRSLGAHTQELIGQFLSESVLLSFFSLCIALVILQLFLSFSENIFNYHLSLDWSSPIILVGLIMITLCTGLLAGSYPAFTLSRISAVESFKSTFRIGGNNWFTKGSLIVQFSLSIGLLIASFIMYQQHQYISEYNLGFDQESVVVIPTQVNYGDEIDTKRIINQFREEVMASPGVNAVTGVSNSFNRGNMVQFVDEPDGSKTFVFRYRVEPNFVDVMDINLVEGRNFSEEFPADVEESILVNEAFLKKYEIENAVGYRLPEKFTSIAGVKIIGVLKDFHFNNLKSEINPMFLTMKTDHNFHHILVKISPENISKTLVHLKTAWQTVRPEKPFESYFLDEDIQKQYESENRWATILGAATMLSLLIAFLGLFGLVALVLSRRTKEISIRKVLGAGMINVVSLVSSDFIKLIGVAILFAAPISYYYMNQWLENFAYRIEIQWWVFGLAGIITLGITLIVVGLQSARAALDNPSKHLNNE